MASQLLTIGGGGYYGPEGGPNRMMLYFLSLTGKKHPRVCLIPTATADRAESILTFVQCYNHIAAHPDYLSLYHVPCRDIETWLNDFDAVYISGGNTRNLLALWKAWDLDQMLIRFMKSGRIVAGESAGANCWFETSNSDYIPSEYNPHPGLGLLKGSVCPHYADKNGRRASFLNMVKTGAAPAGYGISDRAALHFIDGQLNEALIEWPDAGVYKVERTADGEVSETKLDARIVP
ncbi:MAG: peptidase E [Planctomycetota bacterium]